MESFELNNLNDGREKPGQNPDAEGEGIKLDRFNSYKNYFRLLLVLWITLFVAGCHKVSNQETIDESRAIGEKLRMLGDANRAIPSRKREKSVSFDEQGKRTYSFVEKGEFTGDWKITELILDTKEKFKSEGRLKGRLEGKLDDLEGKLKDLLKERLYSGKYHDQLVEMGENCEWGKVSQLGQELINDLLNDKKLEVMLEDLAKNDGVEMKDGIKKVLTELFESGYQFWLKEICDSLNDFLELIKPENEEKVLKEAEEFFDKAWERSDWEGAARVAGYRAFYTNPRFKNKIKEFLRQGIERRWWVEIASMMRDKEFMEIYSEEVEFFIKTAEKFEGIGKAKANDVKFCGKDQNVNPKLFKDQDLFKDEENEEGGKGGNNYIPLKQRKDFKRRKY